MRTLLGEARRFAPPLLLLLLMTACGSGSAGTTPDAGPGPATDGGTGTDGGTEAPEAPEISAIETSGAFSVARPSALLAGQSTPVVLLGTTATVYDPNLFGQPSEDRTVLESGLLVLDRETGRVDVYTNADGLPDFDFTDPGPDGSYGVHAPPFYAMAWLSPDTSFIAAAHQHVVRGDLDADGRWQFRSATLAAKGMTVDAELSDLAVADDGVWVATNQGVFRVDPESLEATAHVGLSAPWVKEVAVATILDGEGGQTQYLVIRHGLQGGAPNLVSAIDPVGLQVSALTLPSELVPTTLLGGNERALVGVMRTGDKTGAVWAVEPAGDGYAVRQVASAAMLHTEAQGYVVPGRMVYDQNGQMIIGGHIAVAAPGGPGGGLIKLGYRPSGAFTSGAEDFFDKQDPRAAFLPWEVSLLALDGQGDLWLQGQQLCSEHRMRTGGLLLLERDDRSRLVRPWVSGVRDMVRDPDSGDLWLALNDGPAGMACDGIPMQQGVCRLRDDGSCELWAPDTNHPGDDILPDPSAVELAFGAAGTHRFAIATRGSGLFAQTDTDARAFSVALDPGLNNLLTSAAWGEDGALWAGSYMIWEDSVDAVVNDRGPHGLGLFELDEDASPALARRYVRNASDSREEEVAGLPSNMVWDVLPLPGTRRALVALGLERINTHYDHLLGEVAPSDAAPGLALVDDTTIGLISAPADAPFEEVVALTRAPDGTILALDAAGVYGVDPEEGVAALLFPAEWGSARPLSLAADADGRVAVGTSRGLWVYNAEGGVVRVLDGSRGFVWSVRFEAAGQLMAGTDQGLARVALDGAGLPADEAAGPFASALWPIEPACTDAGCVCSSDTDCGTGLGCGCFVDGSGAWRCECEPLPECMVDPRSAGCPCNPEDVMACAHPLECLGEVGATFCQEPAPVDCGGVAGCECDDQTPCAEGFHCEYGLAGGLCAEGDACLADCSCTGTGTSGGCPEGSVCTSLGMGMQECVQMDCRDTCSCTGPDAVDGCPSGTVCQAGPMGGGQCVSTGCESDCSCTGPDATPDGCPVGSVCQDGLNGPSCAPDGPTL